MNKQQLLTGSLIERRRSVSVSQYNTRVQYNTTLARNHIPTLRTEIDRIRIVSQTLAHGSWTIAFSWRFAWYISVISASQQRPFR
jgi:hypothetical protein